MATGKVARRTAVSDVADLLDTPEVEALIVAIDAVGESEGEQEITPGHAYVIEPGHDAWVVGDEPVVGFEFESRTAEEYAKEA